MALPCERLTVAGLSSATIGIVSVAVGCGLVGTPGPATASGWDCSTRVGKALRSLTRPSARSLSSLSPSSLAAMRASGSALAEVAEPQRHGAVAADRCRAVAEYALDRDAGAGEQRELHVVGDDPLEPQDLLAKHGGDLRRVLDEVELAAGGLRDAAQQGSCCTRGRGRSPTRASRRPAGRGRSSGSRR